MKAGANAESCGALGAEFQMWQIVMRLEGREHISQFTGIAGDEKSTTRGNIMLGAALAWHLR